MASRIEIDTGYRHVTSDTRALAAFPIGTWLRQWFRVWRWPAGVVAGVVLWLALVAVVGAATRVGTLASGAAERQWACTLAVDDYADVIDTGRLLNGEC